MIVARQTRCPTDNFFGFLGKSTCPSVGSPFPDSGWKRSCLFHHRFMITMCYVFTLYLLCVLCRSAIVYPLLFAKFGRFTPNRLALIGQKYALIGHFHFCRLALIGHGNFRKSLIMNKSTWKYGSFHKICKQLVISLTPFSGYIFSIFLPVVFKTNQSTKLLPGNLLIPLFLRLRPPLLPSPSHVSFK